MRFLKDYLSREQCDSIKGIFILTVFVSHFLSYVEKAGAKLPFHFDQMIVTLFLFYSGYGVMESIKKKGDEYIKSMPKRRILTTLINFDIAVAIFIVMNFLLGNEMTFKQCLLSFVCWDSVGNSNWYIFAIICGYASAFIACYKSRFRQWGGVISLIMLVGYMGVLSFFKGGYWYDTILCFPIGMLYSQHKEKIENIVGRFYWIIFAMLTIIYIGTDWANIFARGLVPNARAIAFVLLVVMITMKVSVRYVSLGWCGKNLFPLYIYQRIPMIILFALDPTGFASWHIIPYFIVSFSVTICIAKLYSRWKLQFT